MPHLVLYPTFTSGSCMLSPTIAFSPLKSRTDVRICLLLGLPEVRGCTGLVSVSLPETQRNSEVLPSFSRAASALSPAMGNTICGLPQPRPHHCKRGPGCLCTDAGNLFLEGRACWSLLTPLIFAVDHQLSHSKGQDTALGDGYSLLVVHGSLGLHKESL